MRSEWLKIDSAKLFRKWCTFIVCFSVFSLGGAQEMSAKNPYKSPQPIIAPAPEREQIKDWYLDLAGDDADRRAVIERWLVQEGISVAASYVHDRFEQVHFIDSEVASRDLDALAHFPEVKVLYFERAKLSDETLVALAKQKHIMSIQAEDGRYLDNRFCRAVAELPNLQALRLINTTIDDDGAGYLSRLEKLKGLGLNGSKVTSRTLVQWAYLQNLKSLGLAGTRVDDDGLRHLAGISKLEWLDLDGTQVTDAGIEHLRPLKSIRVLLLGNTLVTDKAVEVFVSFDAPAQINLEGTKITKSAVRLLAPLPKLGDVNLRNTSIDDESVPFIEGMKVLHAIDLRGTKISKEGITRIRAALKPTAALHNDHGVPIVNRESVRPDSASQ